MFGPSVEKIAVELFLRLVNNPEVQKQAYDSGLKAFDFVQLKTGNVNRHSLEEAIQIATSSCLRKDRESKARVAAFVSGLYLQHQVERAAQVGGSLLERFGKSWFPHINNRELRFALRVDSELEEYLYNQISNH